jgi:general L-amino acid transport system permease protein
VIIGIAELLGAANRITAQQEFRNDFFEALVFVAFIYWVLCSTMSRASQRLETRLGVGTR